MVMMMLMVARVLMGLMVVMVMVMLMVVMVMVMLIVVMVMVMLMVPTHGRVVRHSAWADTPSKDPCPACPDTPSNASCRAATGTEGTNTCRTSDSATNHTGAPKHAGTAGCADGAATNTHEVSEVCTLHIHDP